MIVVIILDTTTPVKNHTVKVSIRFTLLLLFDHPDTRIMLPRHTYHVLRPALAPATVRMTAQSHIYTCQTSLHIDLTHHQAEDQWAYYNRSSNSILADGSKKDNGVTNVHRQDSIASSTVTVIRDSQVHALRQVCRSCSNFTLLSLM